MVNWPNPDALLSHIISQTRSNVEFLVSQNQISDSDGRDIIAKLPTADSGAIVTLSQATQRATIGPPEPIQPSSNQTTPVRRGVPPPPRRAMRVRALWNWNDHGEDPNDLTFRAGEIFEVITETNPDWWTGSHNGRQGLFPSNYVERLDESSQLTAKPTSPAHDRNFASQSYSYQQHQPPMGPPLPMGPPSNVYQNQPVAYNPYMAPPGTVAAQPAAPIPEQPPKKGKFGGMGNTLAQSAVGGVGFGAGSAVGSGIINSIF